MRKLTQEALQEEIASRLEESQPLFLAIEGPCATGKTTLGRALAQGHTLVSMDDFFLSPDLRTEEIGGNIDQERVLTEILVPLSQGNIAKYRPYHCQSGSWGEEISLFPSALVVVEGVYTLLPSFRPYFHRKLFLTATWEQRKARLLARGGEDLLARFEAEWIPRENRYFQAYQVEEHCDFVMET